MTQTFKFAEIKKEHLKHAAFMEGPDGFSRRFNVKNRLRLNKRDGVFQCFIEEYAQDNQEIVKSIPVRNIEAMHELECLFMGLSGESL